MPYYYYSCCCFFLLSFGVPGGSQQYPNGTIYVPTRVDGNLVTIADLPGADTLIGCLARCRVRATCSVVQFEPSSRRCNILKLSLIHI